ncbi:MAG: tetratricopeptide repeat protein [Acidobacteriota bacterium]|nr:tetratricopeptide repeat protein [Acidobacteriota bacterium]MDH3785851.1 tetratricopeptide repeat protein [Acidobacteriota bacterium]
MAKGLSRKELKQDEIKEAAFELGHWIEEHLKTLLIGVGAVVVVAALVGGGFWLKHRSLADARARVSVAIDTYGDLEQSGFVDGAALEALTADFKELSGSSAPGKMATYYQALALAEADRRDDAIALLEPLTASTVEPKTLMAAAVRFLGECYMRSGRDDEAVALLEKQLTADGSLAPELALLELARIARANGQIETATDYLKRIRDEYPETAAAQEASGLLGT